MKWLHLLAAFAGFAVAAIVVVLVFGQADREGSTQQGEAPEALQAGADSSDRQCGKFSPGAAASPKGLAAARKSLPAIIDEKQREVSVAKGDQVAWIVRLHALLGACTDEVGVYAREISVAVSFPKRLEAEVDAYTYQAIKHAFTQPLSRPTLTLNLTVGGERRTAVISRKAWSAFQSTGPSVGVSSDLQGLRQFRRKVGYGPKELQFTGW